jgi:hypothetical protein
MALRLSRSEDILGLISFAAAVKLDVYVTVKAVDKSGAID